jgi:hypothetical protein
VNAFDLAAKAILADANMASDAIYRAGGLGLGVAVRAIRRAPDRAASFGDGRFLTDSVLLDVAVADVPAAAMGDTFQIGAVIYEVRSDPARDVERIFWTCEVREL